MQVHIPTSQSFVWCEINNLKDVQFRTGSKETKRSRVARWQRRGNCWWQNLRHPHLLKNLHCEMLESANVNCAFLASLKVATSYAKIASWTNHSTRETQGIVRQNSPGCAIVVLGGDASDEGLDIQLSRARLLTGSVGTLQTSRSFF